MGDAGSLDALAPDFGQVLPLSSVPPLLYRRAAPDDLL